MQERNLRTFDEEQNQDKRKSKVKKNSDSWEKRQRKRVINGKHDYKEEKIKRRKIRETLKDTQASKITRKKQTKADYIFLVLF